MEMSINDALRRGVKAQQTGRLAEADRFYTAILKIQPQHPDANHNMGLMAGLLGKYDQSIDFFWTALKARPSENQFWISYFDSLLKIGKLAEARILATRAREYGVKKDILAQFEQKFGQFKSSKPESINSLNPPEKEVDSLIAHYNKAEFTIALQKTGEMLRKYPESAKLHNIEGAIYKGLGSVNLAIKSYYRALEIKPDDPEVYNNLGNATRELGNVKKSIVFFNKAIELDKNFAMAFNNLGTALAEMGSYENAINKYCKAIELNPNTQLAYFNLAVSLGKVRFLTARPDLHQFILKLLESKNLVRPAAIAPSIISLLKHEPEIQKVIDQYLEGKISEKIREVILKLSAYPLLMKLMSVSPLADLELERVLQEIRSAVLFNCTEINFEEGIASFQTALALQCFTNEYLYNETDAEYERVLSLNQFVENELSNGRQPKPQIILCLASYKALNKFSWVRALQVTENIKEVSVRQQSEPSEEAILKFQIPALGGISDDVSLRVRDQYEENPYPRWINLGLSLQPVSLIKFCNDQHLSILDKRIFEVETPSILVAGCGTGQHPISAAARLKNCELLALDLSLSSLAYAKRKAIEFGFPNIKFVHGDILSLEKLNRKFDIIECSGVLHHMQDPIAGWRSLIDSLKPGGLMKIGLYSELARESITKIRAEIHQFNISPTLKEMKDFRGKIIRSNRAYHQEMFESLDFFGLSTLRDLLFHTKEHHFTLPQIKKCITDLGLHFCGFQMEALQSRTEIKKKDRYDLDLWSVYEESNPTAFSAMYQFWCQKK